MKIVWCHVNQQRHSAEHESAGVNCLSGLLAVNAIYFVAGLARHGTYKHSPRRRITFPTHIPSPENQLVLQTTLAPVQEGKQLPAPSHLPGLQC